MKRNKIYLFIISILFIYSCGEDKLVEFDVDLPNNAGTILAYMVQFYPNGILRYVEVVSGQQINYNGQTIYPKQISYYQSENYQRIIIDSKYIEITVAGNTIKGKDVSFYDASKKVESIFFASEQEKIPIDMDDGSIKEAGIYVKYNENGKGLEAN